jgi:integrase
MPNTDMKCPQCGSEMLYKDGLRYLNNNISVQRWLCRNCGYRFSEKKALQKSLSGSLNIASVISSNCQGSCEAPSGAPPAGKAVQTLVEVETRTEKLQREGTEDEATIKGKIIEFHWWMLKQGYDESTAKHWAYLLKRLTDLGANLQNSESIKEILAKNKWSDGYKANFIEAYTAFLEMEGKVWNPPKYKRPQKLTFIPTETEIDQLIAAAGKITGAFLQGLKDTGADPGELVRARWIDVDKETKTLKINFPVKGHNARIVRVSDEFLNRIMSFPKTSETIFNRKRMCANFWAQRKRIARKLQNPRILEIHFTTFRHWKGTMEYHRTKDIVYVQKLLGHKSLQSTMVYIDYEKACFGTPNNEKFYSKIATNVGEAAALIEDGWEYVTGEYMDGGKIFRKRK